MAEPGLRPKEANAIVCRCPLTVTGFVQGEKTGSKPLRDLKGYPVLQHRWRWVGGGVGGGNQPLLLSSAATHTQTNTHVHMSVSCRRLTPPNLTRLCPHSWVDPAALSVIAPLLHDHTELRHRGRLRQHRHTFKLLSPGGFKDQKQGGSTSHICRDLTRKGITLRFFQRGVCTVGSSEIEWLQPKLAEKLKENSSQRRFLLFNWLQGHYQHLFVVCCYSWKLFLTPRDTQHSYFEEEPLFKDGPVHAEPAGALGQHEQHSVSELKVQDAPASAAQPADDLHRGHELWRRGQRGSVTLAGRSLSALRTLYSHRHIQVDARSFI